MITKSMLCELIPHQRIKNRVKASAHTKTYSCLRKASNSFDWTRLNGALVLCQRVEVVARITTETE